MTDTLPNRLASEEPDAASVNDAVSLVPRFDANTSFDDIVHQASQPNVRAISFADGKSLAVSEIDRLVPCFTPGTAIATPRGEVPVESLKIGDRVITRDNGIQTITWASARRLAHRHLQGRPELRPIRIKAGALGDGLPEQDMLVSPTHRLLITSELAQLYFDQSEVLVSAKHMLAMDGVEIDKAPYITYIHFMCAKHEIVLSNGVWSESYQPSDFSLKGLDEDQRQEIFTLFPDLKTDHGVQEYNAARRTLKKHEADILLRQR
ncbi:Hint domain-containing protein [Loktanella sp. Alg231-35]|uniref:Hint domain-containing protein n=1 Tax=Loktanella sp. Alg231-35 TaxID=1922220 RepID=UPI00131F05C5|nr:Hint domain-containing protein [Loktanella sp. Alg231-35]